MAGRIGSGLRGLATFVAGAALGATATAGTALLLYTGEGFLRTATFLVALLLAGLGGGIWVGSARGRLGPRWILLVLAYAAAGVFAGFWSANEPLRGTGIGGALAVLLILAEPAYLAGSLLAGLNALAPRSSLPAIAFAGGAVGVMLAGSYLIPGLDAPMVFFGAAVAVTLAGGLQGTVEAGTIQEERMDMNDRVVLVTGVGHPGQLGYAVAKRLLAAGARVFISDRAGTVKAIAAELGPVDRIGGAAADLLNDADVEALIDAVRARFGRLDAVVNVAGGLGTIASVEDTSPDSWRKEIERNADTAYRVTRAALPLLRERGGAVVSFASPAAVRALPQLAAYSAAKAAIVAFTRALAIEERDRGIRVNAIAPGMIDTEQNRKSVDDPESKRWVTREQIADVVLFLVSDAGAGVNGELVKVLAATIS